MSSRQNRRDERGQLATLEGLTAALILVGLLLFITQSASVTTPQTELTTDMKLYQKTADTFICVDRLDESNSSVLKTAIESWGGSPAVSPGPIPPGDGAIQALDSALSGYFSADVAYNVEIRYSDGAADYTVPVITHGKPSDNSVVASRLVTINRGDPVSAFWAGHNRYPQVVEVRLISWYL